jgi:hypothetical protein
MSGWPDYSSEPAVTVLNDHETKKDMYLCVMYKGRYCYIKLDENEELPVLDGKCLNG